VNTPTIIAEHIETVPLQFLQKTVRFVLEFFSAIVQADREEGFAVDEQGVVVAEGHLVARGQGWRREQQTDEKTQRGNPTPGRWGRHSCLPWPVGQTGMSAPPPRET